MLFHRLYVEAFLKSRILVYLYNYHNFIGLYINLGTEKSISVFHLFYALLFVQMCSPIHKLLNSIFFFLKIENSKGRTK